MFRYLHIAGPLCAGAVIGLAACTAPVVEKARNLDIQGRDATAEAAREYRRLALYEDKMMWDRASAKAFSEKALAASQGRMNTAAPARAVSDPEIAAAYRYLNAMLRAGGDRVAPKAAGQAVARLDCWSEQAAEGDQPLDIGFCRDGFHAYAAETARALQAAGHVVPVPMPTAKSFSVTFPLGSAEPLPDAAQAIDAAARYARTGGEMRIVLGGHADRSGSPLRNQQLSQRRADVVAQLLRARGVPENQISTIGFGETYPRVVTPDGQRSPENRRVEIVIGPAETL